MTDAPGTTKWAWDAEGRLKSVDNGITEAYTYNTLGQRVRKHVGASVVDVAFDTAGWVT